MRMMAINSAKFRRLVPQLDLPPDHEPTEEEERELDEAMAAIREAARGVHDDTLRSSNPNPQYDKIGEVREFSLHRDHVQRKTLLR